APVLAADSIQGVKGGRGSPRPQGPVGGGRVWGVPEPHPVQKVLQRLSAAPRERAGDRGLYLLTHPVKPILPADHFEHRLRCHSISRGEVFPPPAVPRAGGPPLT